MKAKNLLIWLGQHQNYELSYQYPDYEDVGEWQVHSVNGGRNDREWTLIGRGETPLAALEAAYEQNLTYALTV